MLDTDQHTDIYLHRSGRLNIFLVDFEDEHRHWQGSLPCELVADRQTSAAAAGDGERGIRVCVLRIIGNYIR